MQKVYKDACGNFIFISLTTMDKDLLLVNVYNLNRDNTVSRMGLSDIIMGGDWNLVLDPNMYYCINTLLTF